MSKYSGIYKIQSIIKPKRIYIGSSVDISKRWKYHLLSLKKEKHHSITLQRHYKKYGIADLQFSILLGCDKEDLLKIEQYFIDLYNPYFNISKKAGSCLGIKRGPQSKELIKKRIDSRKGYKHSEKTKLKQSLSMSGKKQNVNHIKKLHTPELNKKRSETLKGRDVYWLKGVTPWNKGIKKKVA